MPGLGEPVIDVVLRTGKFEAVGAEDLAGSDGQLDLLDRGAGILRFGQVDAIVGEHSVHLVRHCGDEMTKEVASDPSG